MKILITIILLVGSLIAQERVLLRIGQDGQQEAIPLKKGERAKDVIERLEQQRAQLIQNPTGLVDTLKHFTSVDDLTTNFGFTHQDVALQWYLSQAQGTVKEVWWRNYSSRGSINKATVRAWHMDRRITQLPLTAVDATGRMGYYEKTNDGDGLVTPFRNEATDTSWKPGNGSNTSIHFDPLASEAKWLPGGLQVLLDSGMWQGIALESWGDSLRVQRDEVFGFSIMNDSKATDGDARLEILSTAAIGAPYHSLKFYEIRTAAANTPGWQIRGYEWGMYVVMEYTSCRAPKLTVSPILGTTLSTLARKICLTVSGFECASPADTVFTVGFYYKKGRASLYDSVIVNAKGGTYCFEFPPVQKGDTVYYYFAAYNDYLKVTTPARSFIVFIPKNSKLLIHNNAMYSSVNSKLIYTGTSTAPGFDYWSAPNDGTGEMQDLLAYYDKVLVADGSFPSRNVYPYIKQWFAGSTPEKKKYLFFTSQDYGCFIQGACSDTIFSSGTWEYDFLGLEKLGPQDLPPSNREHRMIPMQDTVTNYLIRFQIDSNLTLWSDPTFELGFAGYMDAMVPRPEAKVLFREGKDSLPVGIIYRTDKFSTLFTGFDIGTLQFKIDTSMEGGWITWWINDVKSVSAAFFESLITDIKNESRAIPQHYSLSQNYPNPFNPSTAIEYSIASRSAVTIFIYNVLGQKVATLMNETKDPGSYRAEWNASRMASGLYFYEMQAGSFTSVKKMVLLR